MFVLIKWKFIIGMEEMWAMDKLKHNNYILSSLARYDFKVRIKFDTLQCTFVAINSNESHQSKWFWHIANEKKWVSERVIEWATTNKMKSEYILTFSRQNVRWSMDFESCWKEKLVFILPWALMHIFAIVIDKFNEKKNLKAFTN